MEMLKAERAAILIRLLEEIENKSFGLKKMAEYHLTEYNANNSEYIEKQTEIEKIKKQIADLN